MDGKGWGETMIRWGVPRGNVHCRWQRWLLLMTVCAVCAVRIVCAQCQASTPGDIHWWWLRRQPEALAQAALAAWEVVQLTNPQPPNRPTAQPPNHLSGLSSPSRKYSASPASTWRNASVTWG